MCGGRPFLMASGTKIRRKSRGESVRASPPALVGPVAAGADERFLDRGRGERAVFGADVTLEQQRHRRVLDLLADVVGGNQRYRPVGGAQASDDGAEDVGEFRADQQEPFGVGLGRGDPQQRYDCAGGREPVPGARAPA
jgi:hypothetical protein